ncbi:MAG TPA: segregation/condensation protein A, partial [Dehalococcoidia bacterium]|nr:segregation/condensation protein A [Dehalococcoidia bacterium]
MTDTPVMPHHPFSVALDVFEGPLDLLLSLVQAAKLEITEVALVQVTGQYLARLRSGEQIDHRDLADFVAIGARLIELKSRALLPSPPRDPPDEPEPNPDSLVELLRRYQQFKQAAALLREREEEALRGFPRL